MKVDHKITGDVTVRDVLTAFPSLETVFARHGLAGCGGPNGPEEPIGFFALVHRVDAQALIKELNQELARGRAQSAQAQPRPPQQRVYRPFLIASLAVALTMGFTTGTVLLLTAVLGLPAGSWWLTHAETHGSAQLFGWAGLFTMGIAYHVVPRFRGGELAFPRLVLPSLVLVAAAVVGRGLSQGFSQHPWGAALLISSGVGLLLGMGLFAAIVSRTLRASSRRHEPFEPWLLAGVAWAVVAAVLQLAVLGMMVTDGSIVARPALNAAFLHAALFGFLVNAIIGVSVRVLPAFLHLPAPRTTAITAAAWLFNAGLAWQVAAWTWEAGPRWWAGGALIQVTGMVLVTFGLGPFRRGRPQAGQSAAAYKGFGLFVRSAYVWFAIAGGLLLYLALGDLVQWQAREISLSVARHAVALGVVTMMIMGMAARVLPVFEGKRLQSPRLMDTAFVLLTASVALRTAFSLTSVPASRALLGLSGVAGLAAVVLFAIVVARTL
ncbi:MAG: hypothetical protein FJ315_04330, partial [SAR202 cluster bacterium]|nr:hypothetical protein [SAR202 cluster bacterium]